MHFLTLWTYRCVLLVLLVTPSMTEDNEDFSNLEKSLFHYHEYKNADLLQGRWSRRTFCRAVSPRGVRIEYVQVEKQEIMLESMNCTKIEIELLTCAGDVRNLTGVHLGWSSKFLSGPYGEIYVVHPPSEKTKCNDPDTDTIQWAVVRGGRGVGRSLRLWGVDNFL